MYFWATFVDLQSGTWQVTLAPSDEQLSLQKGKVRRKAAKEGGSGGCSDVSWDGKSWEPWGAGGAWCSSGLSSFSFLLKG